MSEETPSGKRQTRPNCVTCKHSVSFHGADLGSCRALGCKCAFYEGVTQLGFDTITLDEAAIELGLPDSDAVRALSKSPEVETETEGDGGLELEWVPESMLDTRLGSDMVWRVKRTVLDAYLTAVRNT